MYAWTRGALRTGEVRNKKDSETRQTVSARPQTEAGFFIRKNGMRKKVKGKRTMDLLKLIEMMCGMMYMSDLLEPEGRTV